MYLIIPERLDIDFYIARNILRFLRMSSFYDKLITWR